MIHSRVHGRGDWLFTFKAARDVIDVIRIVGVLVVDGFDVPVGTEETLKGHHQVTFTEGGLVNAHPAGSQVFFDVATNFRL